MQIYLKQIAFFGLIEQCIWSRCPETHIKNLMESTILFICSSWDLREMHCAIKQKKAICLGAADFSTYYSRTNIEIQKISIFGQAN